MANLTMPDIPYSPNNTIRIMRGACFERSMEHTVLFSNESSQLSYMESVAQFNFNTNTPVRIASGVVRVENPADAYFDCNYIGLRNSDFNSGKWYYGFIDSVDFVDFYRSDIHFTIDPIQTFMFDWVLPNQCFVNRMHWPTDEIGDNLMPDNLELGDYIIQSTTQTDEFDDYSIVVAATFDEYYQDSAGKMYNGIYSGLTYNVFSSASAANTFIENATTRNKADGIVAVFMMPTAFISEDEDEAKHFSFTYQKQVNTIDGYIPRNNKLFTHPYSFLQVSNMSGQSAEYKWEYMFENAGNYVFDLYGDFSPSPSVVLIPQGYNMRSGLVTGNNPTVNLSDYGLTIAGFPQCSWVTDAYQAYLAQLGSINAFGMNITGQDLQYASMGVSALSSLFSLNVGGVASSALNIASAVAKQNARQAMPPQAGGNQSNSTLVAMKAKDFVFNEMSIRAEFARMIDDYWTMYGYPCNELQNFQSTTNPTNNRRYWNYVQTTGMLIGGNIPATYVEQIQGYFNRGITFWHDPSYVGMYGLTNSPRT